jgi:hypothetical protein
MQHYKNYPIRVSAIYRHGAGWNAQAIVFEPDPDRPAGERPLRELKRLTSAGMIFLEDKQEAENLALILCHAWIDGRENTKGRA